MSSRLTRRMFLLFALTCLPVMAGSSPNRNAAVSFHVETDANDNPKMVFAQTVQGQQRMFRRLPDLSGRDLAGFRRIRAVGGNGAGAMFRLKESAAKRWQALTTSNINRWVISQVNGRVVDGFVIDQPINDGVVVIWKDLSEADLALLEKEFPQLDAKQPSKKP